MEESKKIIVYKKKTSKRSSKKRKKVSNSLSPTKRQKIESTKNKTYLALWSLKRANPIRDEPENLDWQQKQTGDYRKRRIYEKPKHIHMFLDQVAQELQSQENYINAMELKCEQDFMRERITETHMFHGRGTRKLRYGCDWKGLPNVQKWVDKNFSDHDKLPGPNTTQAARLIDLTRQLFPHTRLSVYEAFIYTFHSTKAFTKAWTCANRYATSTINQYEKITKKIVGHYGFHRDINVFIHHTLSGKFDLEDIQGYFFYMLVERRCFHYIRAHCCAINYFLRDSKFHNFHHSNTWKDFWRSANRTFAEKSETTDILTIEELKEVCNRALTMFNTTESSRQANLIHLVFVIAICFFLRPGEVCGLYDSETLVHKKYVDILVRYPKTAKGINHCQPMRCYITGPPDSITNVFSLYTKIQAIRVKEVKGKTVEPAWLLHTETGRKLKVRKINQWLKDVIASFPKAKWGERKKITFYTFRTSMCCHSHSADVDYLVTKNYMRHKSNNCTAHYINQGIRESTQIADKLFPLFTSP